ncbi:MAG: hypothetical protein M0Z95_25080 [Actinomycetota bacterium]|nr:hypothetical protein [Actinomycetota bacterium]
MGDRAADVLRIFGSFGNGNGTLVMFASFALSWWRVHECSEEAAA